MCFFEIRKHLFEEMGSLDVPGTTHTGGLAHEATTGFTDPGKHLAGPFASVEDCHKHTLHLILKLLFEGRCTLTARSLHT